MEPEMKLHLDRRSNLCEALGPIISTQEINQLDTVEYGYNLNSLQAEAGGSKFKAKLDNIVT